MDRLINFSQVYSLIKQQEHAWALYLQISYIRPQELEWK